MYKALFESRASRSEPSGPGVPEANGSRLAKHYWILNAVFFQLGWFVCVLAGSGAAIVFTTTALVLHFVFAPVHKHDIVSVAVALFIGLAHDNLLGYFGIVDYTALETGGLAPLWLTCLWVLMALTLNHALRFFYQRPFLLAIMGAMGGPLAYFGGVELSSVEWGVKPLHGVAVLVVIWLFLLPLHRAITLGVSRLCESVRSA